MAYPEPNPTLAMIEARVRDAIAEERGPSAAARTWPRGARLAIVAAGLGVLVAYVLAFVRREDFSTLPVVRYWLFFGLYALLIVGTVWQAFRPLWKPPAARWTVHLVLALGLVAPLVPLMWPELPTRGLATMSVYQHANWAFYCWAVGLFSGTALLLLVRTLARAGRHFGDEALLAAVACGVAGVLALHIECANNFRLHLLLGHVPVPALLWLGARSLGRS